MTTTANNRKQDMEENLYHNRRYAMKLSDQVFTVDELAVYLKVSKSTLHKLLSEGKVPGQKVGRHWRFRKAAIDRWLEDDSLRSAGTKASKIGNGDQTCSD